MVGPIASEIQGYQEASEPVQACLHNESPLKWDAHNSVPEPLKSTISASLDKKDSLVLC